MAEVELVNEVKVVLSEYDMPLTLRQVFYQLVSRRVLSNTETNYKRSSLALAVEQRRSGVPRRFK